MTPQNAKNNTGYPTASQSEILASLESLGVIAKDPAAAEVVGLARAVGLKGFSDPDGAGTRAQPASQSEILASLEAMGLIAEGAEAAEVVELARSVGLKGFEQ
ncbi:hypothetical protein OLX02_01625 [Novosphingobium sp. KCTC 2891]|uniref:hypothetical protein n=1 Tax=Novosphingobium sp. KCTC 2891 TaxID=2989730 RepID=UPI00222148B4|nr:hypothetical protein [Novosphingobium sp. KCTC 2891]MCW1381514.1 hypothetical protein [Novosphingobium sp. KCTC 2891]